MLGRELTTQDFGVYSFAMSFVLLASYLFEFGLLVPAGRRTALVRESEPQCVAGAVLVLFIPIGLAFTLFVWGSSYAVKPWFDSDAGSILRWMAPFAFGYPLVLVAQVLGQGMQRLRKYSVSLVVGRLLLLGGIIGLAELNPKSISPSTAAVIQSITLSAGLLLFVWTIRPAFKRIRLYAGLLVRDAHEYGFQLYVGRALGLGTYNMDVLMVSAFAGSRAVGYYVLAGTLTGPILLPATAIGSALFKRMANESRIPASAIVASSLIGVVGLIGIWIVARPVIVGVISPRYLPAVSLVLPLAAAQGVRGVTTLFNTFLTAHGAGRELRNSSVLLTVSNVVLNFGLIPRYGALGAAWASLFALLANLLAHVYYYRKGDPSYGNDARSIAPGNPGARDTDRAEREGPARRAPLVGGGHPDFLQLEVLGC